MKKRFLSIVAMILGLTLCLCACGGGGKNTYKVIVSPSEHGVVTVDQTKAKEGVVITVTATPDSGYYLSALMLNGVPCGLTFAMPKGNAVVQATFSKESSSAYGVVVDCSDGGTAFASVLNATAGTHVDLTVTEEPLYALNRITVNGERIEGTSFIMPEGEAIVYVEFVKDGTYYTVTPQNDRHGVVTADCAESRAGGTVALDHFPVAGYVLDHYTVNGAKIEGNTFAMPRANVTVSAVFRSVTEGASAVIASVMAAGTAYSHWFFECADDGLLVTVKVMDGAIITSHELEYRDYVEVMLHNLNKGFEWKNGATVKLTVTADGKTFVRHAIGQYSLSNIVENSDLVWSASVQTKQVVKKDGYTGYEVTMLIPYEIVGLTKATAAGNLAICPAMNNAESVVTWNWEHLTSCTWFNPSTYLVAQSNGSVR